MKRTALALTLMFCLYTPARAGDVQTPPVRCNPSVQECAPSAFFSFGMLLKWLGVTR